MRFYRKDDDETRKFLEEVFAGKRPISVVNPHSGKKENKFVKYNDTENKLEAYTPPATVARSAADGVLSGTESVLNGVTLGGYNWLDRQFGLGAEERRRRLQQLAEEANVGGLNKAAHFVSELGGAGMTGVGLHNRLAQTGLKGLPLATATGVSEGTVMGYTGSDKWDEVADNIAINNMVAAPLSALGYGVARYGPPVVQRGVNYAKDVVDSLKVPHYPGMEGGGKFFKGYRHRPDEAIDKLLKEKDGYVRAAMRKEGIGDIDFVYGKDGDKGYGLAHIVERRNQQGIDGEKFVRRLPEVIEGGSVYRKAHIPNSNSINDGRNETIIRDVWDGNRNNWMLTGYELRDNMLSEGVPTGLQTYGRSHLDKQHLPLPNTPMNNAIIPPAINAVNNESESLDDWWKRRRRF